MARAKRTHRADARRRYRAAMESESVEAESEEAEAAPTRRAAAPAPARSTGEAVRLGIGGALRASFHPLNVREDLAALPSLVRHRAFWLPALVTVAAAIASSVTAGADAVTPFLFAYFVVTPALGGVFLAGFLAPRASWLLGILVSVVAAVCYIVMGIGGRLPEPYAAQFATVPRDAILSTILLSPVLGALFAAVAAWYRRFLALTNPNRGRRPQSQPVKRVGDGRSRSTTAPKAGTKAPARR